MVVQQYLVRGAQRRSKFATTFFPVHFTSDLLQDEKTDRSMCRRASVLDGRQGAKRDSDTLVNR